MLGDAENLPSPQEFSRWKRQMLNECRQRMTLLAAHVKAYEAAHDPLPRLTQAERTGDFNSLPEPKKQARLKAKMVESGDWKGERPRRREEERSMKDSRSGNRVPSVYVLTWCQDMTAFYGSALVFQTLRVGFPTAKITVVDNASLPEACTQLAQLAYACDAEFVSPPAQVSHPRFLGEVLTQQAEGGVVFLDPDLCFWESGEGWQFPAGTLAAGRRIPAFYDAYTQTHTLPRLHTSLLWVPDVVALRAAVGELRRVWFEFAPFLACMWREGPQWRRMDTGASLYAALPERMYGFAERELDAYDHLFCGSHLARVAAGLDAQSAQMLADIHQAAQQDYRALRGAWRVQEAFFAAHAEPPLYDLPTLP